MGRTEVTGPGDRHPRGVTRKTGSVAKMWNWGRDSCQVLVKTGSGCNYGMMAKVGVRTSSLGEERSLRDQEAG